MAKRFALVAVWRFSVRRRKLVGTKTRGSKDPSRVVAGPFVHGGPRDATELGWTKQKAAPLLPTAFQLMCVEECGVCKSQPNNAEAVF